jgi:hypothetical protein
MLNAESVQDVASLSNIDVDAEKVPEVSTEDHANQPNAKEPSQPPSF